MPDMAEIEQKVGPPMRVEGERVWLVRHKQNWALIQVEKFFDARKIGMAFLGSGPDDTVANVRKPSDPEAPFIETRITRRGDVKNLEWRKVGDAEWSRA